MPYDRAQLNRYKFFHDGGHFDQNFIENVLLPGLSIQAKFAGAEVGVELPHGLNDPIEYIPIKDAALLALDWFEEHQNLESSDVRNLTALLGKASYRQISETLELILRKRVQDPQKLLKSRLAQNVAESRRVKELAEQEAATKAKYHPATDLIAYTRLMAEITRLANLGISPTFINQLIPKHLTGTIDTLTQQRLINVIVSNPKFLRIPELYPDNRDLAKVALTNELMRVITTEHQELQGINNFVGTDEFGEGFYGLTSHLSAQLAQNNISLDDYADLSLKASYSLPHLLPNQSALFDQLVSLNTYSTEEDRRKFARAIMSTIVSSAGSELTADQILNIVGRNLNLPPSQLKTIHSLLESADLLPAIEFQQKEIHYDLVSRRLTSSEKTLFQKGVNPFHAYFELPELMAEASAILAIPNLTEADAKIKIRELYDRQLISDNPSPVELSRLRSWLDRHDTVSFLNLDLTENKYLKRLAGRSKTERAIADAASRIKAIETGFYNKWTKFEENLPWNRAIRATFEWYDKIVEKAILRIPLPGGKKLNVPVLNMLPWAIEGFDKFKRISTLKAYASLGKSWKFANPIRNTLRFALKEYSLGGYSTSGAIFHFGHKVWGKALTWAVAKAGLPSLVKYPTTFAARVLIKMGAKGLAKFGTKAITALIAAGTVVGSILSVGMIVGLVFDVIKMGVDFIKRMVRDVDFRKTVLKFSAGITAFIATVQAIPLLAIAGVIIASIANLFLLAFLWAGSILAGLLIYSNIFKTTINIDSGLAQLFTSIVCDETKSQGGDPVAACANCLVDYLKECYGEQVTGAGISAKGISCLLAKTIAPEVASLIESSATSFTYLQCVGFVRAAAQCGGKPLAGGYNACGYIGSQNSGWNYVAGTSGVKAGNICMIASSGSCTDDKPGHIFVVNQDCGAVACAADANNALQCGSSGCVSNETRIPLSQVAGCLVKN